MRKITLLLAVLTVGLTSYAQQNFTTVFESSKGLETATYSHDCIAGKKQRPQTKY